jgi:CRP-like cAMP-binding protein
MSDSDQPSGTARNSLVGRVPFLDALPAEARRRLMRGAVVRRLPRGRALWSYGDSLDEFFFVTQGRVKLVKADADGREAILDLRVQGQLMCSGATMQMTPFCCSALAQAEEVEVVGFPRHDLLAVLQDSPAAARAFLRELAACSVALCDRVGELAGARLEHRLAMLLLRLADQLGQPREDGTVWIPVALSRQDLADLCNTAVESAIRAMSRLARDGIVVTRPRGFLVRDRAALASLASRPPTRDG